MGTRADFYIGRGKDAEWLGSISHDGYDVALFAADPDSFRVCVAGLLSTVTGSTTPSMGWPWPWDTSATTDYTYAFDEGRLWVSRFGGHWYDADLPEPVDASGVFTGPLVDFPDMSGRKSVASPGSARSGLMTFMA
jgi:hypothetical protein